MILDRLGLLTSQNDQKRLWDLPEISSGDEQPNSVGRERRWGKGNKVGVRLFPTEFAFPRLPWRRHLKSSCWQGHAPSQAARRGPSLAAAGPRCSSVCGSRTSLSVSMATWSLSSVPVCFWSSHGILPVSGLLLGDKSHLLFLGKPSVFHRPIKTPRGASELTPCIPEAAPIAGSLMGGIINNHNSS